VEVKHAWKTEITLFTALSSDCKNGKSRGMISYEVYSRRLETFYQIGRIGKK
jgi:hypothetical protein